MGEGWHERLGPRCPLQVLQGGWNIPCECRGCPCYRRGTVCPAVAGEALAVMQQNNLVHLCFLVLVFLIATHKCCVCYDLGNKGQNWSYGPALCLGESSSSENKELLDTKSSTSVNTVCSTDSVEVRALRSAISTANSPLLFCRWHRVRCVCRQRGWHERYSRFTFCRWYWYD